MRKQQLIWQREHHDPKSLPSLSLEKPSEAVIYFANFLKGKRLKNFKIIDIGCGKGRNTLYFAKLGFPIYGIDYIAEAIRVCKDRAQQNNLSKLCHFYKKPIDKKWPFKNNFFDVAVDYFSSIDIETKKGREIYKKELLRTLKPGGFALIAVVSIDDEIEKMIIKSHPGKEPNSAIWPNGKFQKDFTKAELLNFYKDFQIIKLKKVQKPAFKLGKNYTATNFYLIIRKHL